MRATPLVFPLLVAIGCGDDGPPQLPPGEGDTGRVISAGSGAGTGSGDGTTSTGSTAGTSGSDGSTSTGTAGSTGGTTGGSEVACAGVGTVSLVTFEDEAAFLAALAGAAVRVDFDDVDASGTEAVPIDPDRYVARGLVVRGQLGQFVHTDFGLPGDNIPVSPPNMYAPGPIDDPANGDPGGNVSQIEFDAGGERGCVSGFGLSFVDLDPARAGGSLQVVDGELLPLGSAVVVEGISAPSAFRGLVAIDGTGAPVPAIAGARVVNGTGWPGRLEGKGMALDDFLFDMPTR